jgi:hypothetical protein
MVFQPMPKRNMADLAMFFGVFMLGYALTMGVLYVVLGLFTRRRKGDSKLVNEPGNMNHLEYKLGVEKSGK